MRNSGRKTAARFSWNCSSPLGERYLIVDGAEHAAHVEGAERLFQNLRLQVGGQALDFGARADHVADHQHEAACEAWTLGQQLAIDGDAALARHAQVAEDNVRI